MPKTPHWQGHRRRLRERCLNNGARSLADYELLELLLTYVLPRRDVKPQAKELLARFQNLKGVLDARPADLSVVKGTGPHTAAFVSALKDLMGRYFEAEASRTDLVSSPRTALSLCRSRLEGEKNEAFEVLYLSSKNRSLGVERITEGTLDRAAVFPRRVVEGALKNNAAALIFAHNHPSGDPAPSAEDRALTRALANAARAVDIRVLDHLIIGHGRHFSFAEAGLMGEASQIIR